MSHTNYVISCISPLTRKKYPGKTSYEKSLIKKVPQSRGVAKEVSKPHFYLDLDYPTNNWKKLCYKNDFSVFSHYLLKVIVCR
ncbi:hypothetical protein GCM10009133_39820 [Cocleimonas flava]|uniref:Uncharacterized protein n=1 Tax=Cocleimonas flava TaxID=634765 RepID=A0A4R1F4A9_9GAMM|nr:hypothetical protein EV695_0019 [Cocleimonas flava]